MIELPRCAALTIAKRKRWYQRYKLRYPSHLARTGHKWSEGKNYQGDRTGFCAICGEQRVIRSRSYFPGK